MQINNENIYFKVYAEVCIKDNLIHDKHTILIHFHQKHLFLYEQNTL